MSRAQVAKLWKSCFHDSDAFIRLFFNKLYHPKQTFTLLRNGQVIAALQVLPYTLTPPQGDTPLRLAYIVGCCTHPQYRSRGLMRRLIHDALADARRKGFDLATLIPASTSLFEYYAALGFTTSCFLIHCTYTFDTQTNNLPSHHLLRLNGRNAARFYPFFAHCFQQRRNCIQPNALQFRTAVSDIILDAGNVYVLQESSGGAPLALAFVLPVPPARLNLPPLPYVKEIVASGNNASRALLNHILTLYHAPSLICRTPLEHAGNLPAVPYAMTYPLSDQGSIHLLSNIHISLMLD
jgi:GNAT superfamily N-acetyltransferase